jgi:hypothetical protein
LFVFPIILLPSFAPKTTLDGMKRGIIEKTFQYKQKVDNWMIFLFDSFYGALRSRREGPLNDDSYGKFSAGAGVLELVRKVIQLNV